MGKAALQQGEGSWLILGLLTRDHISTEASHCSLPQTHFLPASHTKPMEEIWDDLPCEQMCYSAVKDIVL